MVVSALYIALVTLHVSFSVTRVLCQCLIAVTHSVRFYVGFGHYIQTILVTKVIPTVVVRIMTSTYSVDIQFFHHFDILQHTFERNDITAVRVHFVTVGSFEEYRLSVYEYLSAFQLNLAESYFNGDYFYYVVAVFQCSGQRVDIRRFGSPFGRGGDG